MNILIIYETYSSGTQTAAEVVTRALQTQGHSVVSKKAREADPTDLTSSDLVILASPSWMVDSKDGQPHEFMGVFMKQAAQVDLADKKFAVFGLGDSTYARFTGAVDHLVEFVTAHHGTVIVEPLRVDEFYFKQSENEQKLQAWANQLATALQQ